MPRPTLLTVTARALATLVACASLAWPAHAASHYMIKEPISQHLRKTSDEFGLCTRRGISMRPLVTFQPKGSAGISFNWDRATDRFVQYPGTSCCVVWMRLG